MPREQGPQGGDAPNPIGDLPGPGEIAKPPGGGSLGKRPEGSGIADKAPGKYGLRDSAGRGEGVRPGEKPIIKASDSSGGDTSRAPRSSEDPNISETSPPVDAGREQKKVLAPKSKSIISIHASHGKEDAGNLVLMDRAVRSQIAKPQEAYSEKKVAVVL